MKTIFFLSTLSLLIGFSASAQTEGQVLSEINDLTRRIRQEAAVTDASTAELLDARDHLKNALILLQSAGTPADRQACFKFAYAKYYMALSSDEATNRAVAACKKITDLPSAEFIYQKAYMALNSAEAMDRAVAGASLPLQGKLDMLQFAYQKHYMALNSADAISKAMTGVARVPRGSLVCLTDLFTSYYRSLNATDAMAKATVGCE